MKTLMDKHTIIKLKLEGCSNRKLATMLGVNRKTIARYWNEYNTQLELLNRSNTDVKAIQEEMLSKPQYSSSNRGNRKYTDEINQALDAILAAEKRKNQILGVNKQNLTKLQMHKMIVAKGFDISYTTIANKVNVKMSKSKECFVRQLYDLGDRLEYDFGEVKLLIEDQVDKYHMAVLSSPGGDFRWAYLYTNQKKEVFMDSHVRFFEMVGGVYKEVVYDNMRNVVKKFIGRTEKELNEDLIKMSIYYGFDINVTNCYSGNEKGYVESSVRIIRNHVFAKTYKFNTLEDAQEYLNSSLIKMNSNSKIDEEIKHLLPYKPKLELANITINKVNKYSFICSDKNFYSVPEYLVDKKVTVKSYYDKLIVFSNNSFVCEHKRMDGSGKHSIDVMHYLNTFLRKPGALKNSLALKSVPSLKTIYDKYFTKEPKQFIEILIENKEKDTNDILLILNEYLKFNEGTLPKSNISNDITLNANTRNQISMYNSVCLNMEVI